MLDLDCGCSLMTKISTVLSLSVSSSTIEYALVNGPSLSENWKSARCPGMTEIS